MVFFISLELFIVLLQLLAALNISEYVKEVVVTSAGLRFKCDSYLCGYTFEWLTVNQFDDDSTKFCLRRKGCYSFA